MNKTKLTSVGTYFLLSLMIHVTLFNDSFVSKAQRQAAPPKLEGTQFEAAVIIVPPRLSKLNTYYIFEAQGKVICRLIRTTPAETKLEYKFDMLTGRLEPKMVYYPGGIDSFDEVGTYKQSGNEVRLEFPSRVVEATIRANGLEGVVTFKDSNKKEHWVVAKSGAVAEPRTSSAIPNPTQQITETNRKRAVPDRTDSSAKLKTGTYKIIATESSDFNGRTSTDSTTFKIKIESVSENGDIKARLYKRGGEGRLKGQVGENGQMQLEGSYIDVLNNEWNLKLKAVVEDDTLINGKYIDANRFFEVRGTFNIGTLEEEF